jgi:hypothetical protein
MFVKLLTLLFSNICVSFSVLVCCRSLVWKCGLKGGIKQKEDVVPVSALDHTRPTIERAKTRSSATTLKPKEHTHNRVHKPPSSALQISLRSLHYLSASLRCCVVGILRNWKHLSAHRPVLEHTCCDQAHPLTWQHTLFLTIWRMYELSMIICILIWWGGF